MLAPPLLHGNPHCAWGIRIGLDGDRGIRVVLGEAMIGDLDGLDVSVRLREGSACALPECFENEHARNVVTGGVVEQDGGVRIVDPQCPPVRGGMFLSQDHVLGGAGPADMFGGDRLWADRRADDPGSRTTPPAKLGVRGGGEHTRRTDSAADLGAVDAAYVGDGEPGENIAAVDLITDVRSMVTSAGRSPIASA